MLRNHESCDLVVRDLNVAYGHIQAVSGVSFDLPSGGIVALLGPNGAGKTSTLRAIAGGLKADVRGAVKLFGDDVLGRPPHRIVKRGMVLVPEGRHVIAPLSVEENLLLGGYQRDGGKNRATLRDVYELFPILHDRRNSPAGLLSGGEQQMLAIGRALMAHPKVILLDEPSMGLSPLVVDRVIDVIAAINGRGTSIVLVEQNAAAAFQIATHAYVLSQGRVVLSGPAHDVRANATVADAFLGEIDKEGE